MSGLGGAREQEGYRTLQVAEMALVQNSGEGCDDACGMPAADTGNRTVRSSVAYTSENSSASGTWFDTESDRFNMFVGLVIMCNAIVIGLETDLPDQFCFDLADNFFNLFFVIEMCLRLSQVGWEYFQVGWNIFDCTLVITGSLDLWIIPYITNGGGLKGFSIMRLLRVMRVLRVLRIFRMFREMTLIAQAFFNAFTSVCWIGILVVIMDYIIAIFLTQLLGHNTDQWEEEEALMVQHWFGSIGSSMFTLFLIMTLAEWNQICVVTMKRYPLAVLFFLFYIIVASYTMVSLITGVISDSLISATRDDEVNKIKAFEAGRRDLTRSLQEMFKEMDIDASATISKQEINDAMTNPKVLSKLKALDVDCSNPDELEELFDSLAKSHATQEGTDIMSLSIPIDSFVTALTVLHGGASAKKTFLLHQDVITLGHQIQHQEEHNNKKQEEMLEMIRQLATNVQELSAKVDRMTSPPPAG